MPDCILTCQYCGKEWKQWVSMTTPDPICKRCGDKNIRVVEEDNTKRDVFGYNSQAPKEDAYINTYRKRR